LRLKHTITSPSFLWVAEKKPECPNFISFLTVTNGFGPAMETQLFRTILLEQCKKLDKNGKPPLVVDVGGNAGYFTTYAASMGCRVIAFEPFPHMMDFLELNVAINHFDGLVTPVAAAVSSETGLAYLEPVCTDAGLSHLSSGGGPSKISVRTVRLSDVIKEDVLLLKIDVEGFEDHVFKGMDELLANYKVKNIVCETKQNGDVEYKVATINKLMSQNYSAYAYPEWYGANPPYAVDTNLPQKVLVSIPPLAANGWIPYEDMFYTLQKEDLHFL